MDRLMTSTDNLAAWINSELEKRGWSIRELGKRAGLSATAISNVLNGHRMPGKRFCIALAHGLGVSREEVFRQAGFLPPLPVPDAALEDALYLFRRLPTDLLDKLGEAAGVADCHAHRFRHTFAINFLRNGGDVFTLQRLLGHSSLDMVKRYVKLAEVDAETAHRRASPADNWNL